MLALTLQAVASKETSDLHALGRGLGVGGAPRISARPQTLLLGPACSRTR